MRKKYEYAEFTRSYCGSVGKILSKFNAFIFFCSSCLYMQIIKCNKMRQNTKL